MHGTQQCCWGSTYLALGAVIAGTLKDTGVSSACVPAPVRGFGGPTTEVSSFGCPDAFASRATFGHAELVAIGFSFALLHVERMKRTAPKKCAADVPSSAGTHRRAHTRCQVDIRMWHSKISTQRRTCSSRAACSSCSESSPSSSSSDGLSLSVAEPLSSEDC